MKKNKSTSWEWTRNLCMILAVILVITGYVSYIIDRSSFAIVQWTFSISLAILSSGIAVHSIVIAKESDEKMKALTNLNFIEKHAMMQQYIRSFKKRSFACIDQCKLDLEATIEVKKWASEDRKEEYIKDLINLKEIALKKNIPKKHKKTLESMLETALEFGIEKDKLRECRQQVLKFIPKRRKK